MSTLCEHGEQTTCEFEVTFLWPRPEVANYAIEQAPSLNVVQEEDGAKRATGLLVVQALNESCSQ